VKSDKTQQLNPLRINKKITSSLNEQSYVHQADSSTGGGPQQDDLACSSASHRSRGLQLAGRAGRETSKEPATSRGAAAQ